MVAMLGDKNSKLFGIIHRREAIPDFCGCSQPLEVSQGWRDEERVVDTDCATSTVCVEGWDVAVLRQILALEAPEV